MKTTTCKKCGIVIHIESDTNLKIVLCSRCAG
jgi:Zn-finger nucleic acid-binding protein